MNQRKKGIILAVITAVMWGIMGIFVRDLTQFQFSNIAISFFRCALAGAAYFVFLLITKPKALKIDLKGLIICILYGAYGAVAYSISFVSYSVAVSRIPVGVATVLMFMSPIWVAILGVFMFREKLEKSKIITIAICFFGAVLVANLIGAGDIRLDGIGILAGVINGIGVALQILLPNLDGIGILAGVINGIGVALQILLPKFFAKDYDRDTLLVYGFLGAAFVLAFGMDFSSVAMHIGNTPTFNLCIWIFRRCLRTCIWYGFFFGGDAHWKYSDFQFILGSVWNRNPMYDGCECSLRKVYAICRSDNDEHSVCFRSCGGNNRGLSRIP